MSNRVINKGFYNIYNDNIKEVKIKIKGKYKTCVFCGHDGSGTNILTMAHLDQNPKNDSDENVVRLCRSCHIKHDQKYHLFSMQTNKKTDNSYLSQKVELRLETVNLIQKQSICILEAYAGGGKIWEQVQKKTDKILDIVKIEIKDNKKGFYLKGDNQKFLPLFDFENFDIIDLDAYGVPFNQLEVIFDKKFKGYVHCTFIQSGMGRLPDGLLLKLGYTKEMIKKIPTLFCRKGIDKLKNYLYLHGVQSIEGYFIDRKNYFYFTT